MQCIGTYLQTFLSGLSVVLPDEASSTVRWVWTGSTSWSSRGLDKKINICLEEALFQIRFWKSTNTFFTWHWQSRNHWNTGTKQNMGARNTYAIL